MKSKPKSLYSSDACASVCPKRALYQFQLEALKLSLKDGSSFSDRAVKLKDLYLKAISRIEGVRAIGSG